MTTVGEVMTKELVMVGPSISVTAAAHAMSTRHAGSALVMQDGALVGIFTERDMLGAIAQTSNADAVRVSAVSRWMTLHPVTVPPDVPVREAMDRMLRGGFRHLPVVEGDQVVGVISMRDLARSISTT